MGVHSEHQMGMTILSAKCSHKIRTLCEEFAQQVAAADCPIGAICEVG